MGPHMDGKHPTPPEERAVSEEGDVDSNETGTAEAATSAATSSEVYEVPKEAMEAHDFLSELRDIRR